MAAFRRWFAPLQLSLGLWGACAGQAAPDGVTRTIDAGEADVQVVQNPRTCAVARVSAGATHTCAVLVDGRVFCWGANDSGQLGVGDYLPRLTPTHVPTSAPAVEVMAGAGATCARLTTAEVACWGKAPGAPGGIPTPTLVPLPGNASGVVAGGGHACALLATGTVMCWGGAELVGDGTGVEKLVPTVVPALPANISSLFASSQHTCARTTTAEVWCWGRNVTGALGQPPSAPVLTPMPTQAFVNPVTILAAGPSQTCAVLAEAPKPPGQADKPAPVGQVACVPPVQASLRPAWGDDIRSLAVGADHVCAIRPDRAEGAPRPNRPDGRLRCVGGNAEGQAGPDPRVQIPENEPAEVLPDATLVRAGSAHTCALRVDRSLWCWGRNAEGQLGIGTTLSTNTPTPVAFAPGCPLI